MGAFIHDLGVREAVSQRLSSIAVVDYVDSPTALIDGASSGTFRAMLTDLQGRRDSSVASLVVDIGARAPTVPLVLYGMISHASLPELCAIYAPGLPIEFVMRGAEPLDTTLKAALDSRLTPTAAPFLFARFLPLAPASLKPFLALLSIKAASRRSVEQLANWVGITRRTVSRRLRKAGWVEPHVVRQSFRALDAIWFMTEQGWSAHQVCRARGFGSPGAVGRLTDRYVGVRPSGLREAGGFWSALDVVQRNLVGDDSTVQFQTVHSSG